MIAVGTDIVWIPKFEQKCAGQQEFLASLFTRQELADCRTAHGTFRYESLAARFAAKEATLKALHIGILAEQHGGDLKQIELATAPAGNPYVQLSPALLAFAAQQGIQHWSVSLSHSQNYALAFVIGYA